MTDFFETARQVVQDTPAVPVWAMDKARASLAKAAEMRAFQGKAPVDVTEADVRAKAVRIVEEEALLNRQRERLNAGREDYWMAGGRWD